MYDVHEQVRCVDQILVVIPNHSHYEGIVTITQTAASFQPTVQPCYSQVSDRPPLTSPSAHLHADKRPGASSSCANEELRQAKEHCMLLETYVYCKE